MLTKTKLALVGALVLGLGTVAQAAGSKDDDPSGGGYRVGPMSQSFGSANPSYHRSMRSRIYARGYDAYGFVPRTSPTLSKHRAYHAYGDSRTLSRDETYIGVQDRNYRHSNGIRRSNGD